MPRGTRRSSRIAAQANKAGTPEVSNIKKPSPRFLQNSRGTAAKTKQVKAAVPTKDQPRRVSPRSRLKEKIPLATAPSAHDDVRIDLDKQIERRPGHARQRRAAQNPSLLKARAQALSNKDVGTQTESFIQTGAQVQGTSTVENHQALIRAPLSKKALHRLQWELQTTDDTHLASSQGESENHNMGKSQSQATTAITATGNTTVYDKRFRNDLTENGVFEQQCVVREGATQELAPRIPKNYSAIRKAIQRDRPHSDDPSLKEYQEYMDLMFTPASEGDVSATLLRTFFGLPFKMKAGHKPEDCFWSERVPITRRTASKPFTQRPKADRAEGLEIISINPDVRNALGGIAVVSKSIGFPNFMIEAKGEQSMLVGHTQNRHSGAVASQAYHEYYKQILRKPEESWDTARVGSIEFNGDVIVGNVHWVSKTEAVTTTTDDNNGNNNGSDISIEDDNEHVNDDRGTENVSLDYHMTRIMNHFAIGLNFDDFKTARRAARNFRDYFFDSREELLQRFEQEILQRNRILSQPQAPKQAPTLVPKKRGRPSRVTKQVVRDQASPPASGAGSSSDRPESQNAAEDTDSQATETEQRKSNGLKRGTEPTATAGKDAKRKRDSASARRRQGGTGLSPEFQSL